MYIKRNLIITLSFGILFLIHMSAQANDHIRSYPQEAYDQAIDEARSEGKLILLDFTAKWCTPCRWMKNTTFKDPTLTKYLSERYIVVNIDIDDFEGYTLKEKYRVKLLPTFIILNSEGQQMAKMEESMGATKMYNICKSYDNGHGPEKHPRPQALPIKEPVLSASSTRSTPAPEQPTKQKHGPKKSAPSKRAEVNPESHYQLQLGVFNDFKNASKLADKVFEYFTENVEIKNINGHFKVLLGYFESKEEAEAKKEALKAKSFESIIIQI